MNLSERERRIAIVMLVAVGFLALYYFLIDPYFTKSAALGQAILTKEQEVQDAENLALRRHAAQEAWKGLLANGLKDDVESADSQLGHALEKWTREAKLTFSSIKPERPIEQKDFYEIKSMISASGPQAAVVQLLWRAETASIPIQINEMTLNTRSDSKGDGSDDLTLRLGVSTLSLNPNYGKNEPTRRPGPTPTERGRS